MLFWCVWDTVGPLKGQHCCTCCSIIGSFLSLRRSIMERVWFQLILDCHCIITMFYFSYISVSSNSLCFLLFFPLSCLFLLQAWVEPWRVSVFDLVHQALPHTWVGAALMEEVQVEVVLLAQGRCAAADAMGSKTLTWTLSSQRRWHCIWTPQALPLLEGEEPGNETPPSVVMSSQTPLHTSATGWSDLISFLLMCVRRGGSGSF